MNRSQSLVRWSSGCRTMACPEGVSCSHPSSFVSVSRVSYAALATPARAGVADGPAVLRPFQYTSSSAPPGHRRRLRPVQSASPRLLQSPPVSVADSARLRPDPRPSPPSVSICLGRLQQSGAPLASSARRITMPYPLRGGRPNVCNTRLITSSDQS